MGIIYNAGEHERAEGFFDEITAKSSAKSVTNVGLKSKLGRQKASLVARVDAVRAETQAI